MRAGGRCEECGRRLLYGEAEYDHRIPDNLGGDNGLDNCNVVCRSCHSLKTKVDIYTIAKAKRNFRRAVGIKKARGRPIPGSRRSPWRKKISGVVEKR